MGRSKAATKKVKNRMTLELNETGRRQMESLAEGIEAASMSEVVRRAIDLYGIVQDARAAGKKLILRRPGEDDREIIIL